MALQGWFAVVAAGINLLECSLQAAVRRVSVLSAPGYTLLCCCFLSGLYTLIKTSVWQ
ncbi:TPA: hypothetical protein HH427_002460 [Escherichia coli]|nr:hypothetical protein [Escherichia coli]